VADEIPRLQSRRTSCVTAPDLFTVLVDRHRALPLLHAPDVRPRSTRPSARRPTRASSCGTRLRSYSRSPLSYRNRLTAGGGDQGGFLRQLGRGIYKDRRTSSRSSPSMFNVSEPLPGDSRSPRPGHGVVLGAHLLHRRRDAGARSFGLKIGDSVSPTSGGALRGPRRGLVGGT